MSTGMYEIFIMVCLSSLPTMSGAEDDTLNVKTEQGVLRGKYWTTWQGRPFVGFTGIPYAQPPVGELRFKPPVPVEPWKGVLDATKPHNVCPQIDTFSNDFPIIGDEDCLYINIYTPQLPKSNKELLPVMFYIHGGSFIMGSARDNWLGPEILLDRDIVLVTVNYRLGAFGFLSTGDDVVPGNNGLKDQNLALMWVYKNIDNFGGDPQRITIFGNSAGGACTHFHMFSPLSKDLIKGAIVQSGSALAAYAIISKEDAVKNAFKLGNYLNCCTTSSRELIEHLRKADAYEIVRQEAKFASWDNDTTIPFRAVVETDQEGAFLIEEPVETLKSGRAANIPLMTGIVSNEAAFKASAIFNKPELVDKLDKYFDKIVPLSFGIVSDLEDSSSYVRTFYFGSADGKLTKSGVTNLYSDGWFLMGAESTLRLHYQYSTKPIYQYLFDYRGSISYSELFGDADHDYGVCHTDDLLYLLNRKSIFPNYKPTFSDDKVSELITTLWANFAATGNPTPANEPNVPVNWNPIQSKNLEYLHIKSSTYLNMAANLQQARLKFWRSLPTGKIKTDGDI